VVGNYNSKATEVFTAFSPVNRPHPLSMPLLQDIDRYIGFIKKKKSCRAYRLCKRDKEAYFEIFFESQYTYVDIAYHLARFQPKNITITMAIFFTHGLTAPCAAFII
jgi:hypothetical protein